MPVGSEAVLPGASSPELHRIATALDEQTAILRAVLQELRRLRQTGAVEPSSLTRADREALGRLLPAVAGVFGSDLFLVREVLAHSNAGLRVVCQGTNGRTLGRLLMRAKGIEVGGYVVSCDGGELGACLWRIERAMSF